MLELQFEEGAQSVRRRPLTGKITELFHPRKDEWEQHFSAVIGALTPLGLMIRGLTPIGRATVHVLALNDEMRQMLRYELWREGLYVIDEP